MKKNLDFGDQEKAEEYQAIELRLYLLRLSFNLILLSLLLFSGLSQAYVHFLSGFSSGPILVGLYFLGLIFPYGILVFPLDFYQGYLLEHRFGLSRQNFSSWMKDKLKGFLLEILIGLFLIEILYFFLPAYPHTWWLAMGLTLIFFSLVLSHLAPLLILPLFYPSHPLKDEKLEERLLNLTEKVGLKAQRVFEMDLSEKTNLAEAALAGMGNTRRILIGDTLLKNYSPEEIEVVFAHELGHYAKRHLLKLGMAQTFLTLGGLYLTSLILKISVSRLGFQGTSDIANFPLLLMILTLFSLLSLPIGNGYSRVLEYEADRYALEATENPQAFERALAKLAKQNLTLISPSPLVESVLYNHPAIAKRIELGRKKWLEPGASSPSF